MPKGFQKGNQFAKGNKPNSTSFKKGERPSKMTEFKKGQVSVFKGRNHTAESNEKNRIAHLGKKATEETKGKQSKNNAHYWLGKKRPEMTGAKHHLFGKHQTEATKAKLREARLRQRITLKDTKIELKVEAELIKRGINYQKQVPLCKVAIVDFYLPEYRIVIQADGDYWHNRPERIQNDIRQNAVLTFNGFNVYRFWEHDINESVENCINKINLS